MIQAATGISRANEGREAGLQAAHLALSQMSIARPTFAITVFSHGYTAEEVMKGVMGVLPEIPMIGFSTTGVLTEKGMREHAVAVAVFYAENLEATSLFIGDYAQGAVSAAERLKTRLREFSSDRALLFADAFNGDIERFLEHLDWKGQAWGGLAAGMVQRGRNYQISNLNAGMGALTALLLHGEEQLISYGFGHGWRASGTMFRITRSRGFWLRTLDGRPASDAYADLFQFPAREWAQEPLMSNVRLYPLGLDRGEDQPQRLRAPLRVEIDGSFRMNSLVTDGQDAHLMVGAQSLCLQAAQRAASDALFTLQNRRPALALVLVDTSWQMLMAATPGAEIDAVRSVIGTDVPLIGGYTLGQIVPRREEKAEGHHDLLDNHILVVLFADEEGFETSLLEEDER